MQFSHTIQLFETNSMLVEDFTEAVFLLNEKMIVTFWNRGAELIYGYSKQEAIGMHLNDILSSEKSQHQMYSIISMLNDGIEWRGDIVFKNKTNELIYCMSSLVSIYQSKNIKETLFVIKDITNRKELKKALNTLNTEAEEQEKIHEIEMTNSLQKTDDGFFSFDSNWCYLHINKKAADLLKRKPSELIGKNVWVEFPEFVNSFFYKLYHEALENNQYNNIKAYSSSLHKWFEIDMYPSGKILSVFFKDISEKRTYETKNRTVEEKYHSIFENAQDGICMIDEHHVITFANICLSNMTGFEREEMKNRNLFDFIHSEFTHSLSECIDRKNSKFKEQHQVILLTKNLESIWVSLQITPIINDNVYSGSLVLITNIEAERESELALKKSNQQLRQFASKLQTVREEERSSIAREIHDDLAQQLTALKMDTYWLSKNVTENNDRVKQKLDSMLSIVSETLNHIRGKALELHPAMLNDLGLIAAIEWQNNQFLSRHSIQIIFSVTGDDRRMPKDVAIAFYRIYQETLSNIAKHANATSVHSIFVSNEKGYYLAITDDGNGFDIKNAHQNPSLGIISMKERSIAIGATYHIDSAPNKGTLVSVFIEF